MILAEMNWPEAASCMFIFGAIVAGFITIVICDCITRSKGSQSKGSHNKHNHDDATWTETTVLTRPQVKRNK